ncbi:MAG: hypothetical protein SGI71_04055 [Verrucomicrobiota bacterium]|nr:hypothetical protein [Verrucomicrobiota bacterium]
MKRKRAIETETGHRNGNGPLKRKGAIETETRSFRVSHAGGMEACSRWLSKERATPPDRQITMKRTPAGVPAISVYVIDIHQPALPTNFRRQHLFLV